MKKFKFSEEFNRKVAATVARYPKADAALIPLMQEVQRELGHFPEEAAQALAGLLGISYARVKGVLTFYTMFRREPGGKYLLQVCRNLSCHLAGSVKLLEYLKGRLGIEEGGTTHDGLFTLITVECLGACGTAPVMMVNDDYHETLTVEKLDKLISDLRAAAKAHK
ncbi:MAG TPA: NADH-quinone oxidoreductase subunit NuoE [Elusimicrobia bacterium]|nr:NADH-quinone oxidoreductase subunit NuoE [Elusimicrobiota bacterium]